MAQYGLTNRDRFAERGHGLYPHNGSALSGGFSVWLPAAGLAADGHGCDDWV